LLGQELSKRALHTSNGETDNDDADADADADSDFDNDDDEEGDRPRNSIAAQAAKKMKKHLDAMGGMSNSNNNGGGDTGRYQKLLDMDFMRKATDRLSEKAKLEAQQALLELQQMEAETEGYGDDQAGIDDRDLSAHERVQREEERQKELQEREVKMREARLAVNGLLSSSGVFGNSSTSGFGMLMPKKKGSVTTSAWSSFLPSLPDNSATVSNEATAVGGVGVSENPWLQKTSDSVGFGARLATATGGKSKAGSADSGQIYVQLDNLLQQQQQQQQQTGKRKGPTPILSEHVQTVATDTSKLIQEKSSKKAKKGVAAEDLLSSQPPQIAANMTKSAAPTTSTTTGKKERKAILLPTSQAELVQQAFAAPDLEADFAHLKATAVERELGIAENERKALSTGRQVIDVISKDDNIYLLLVAHQMY